MELLKTLPDSARVGVSVVNRKHQHCEHTEDISAKIDQAIRLFGRDRVLFHLDCGFTTFADNPICSTAIAQEKLTAIAASVTLFSDH